MYTVYQEYFTNFSIISMKILLKKPKQIVKQFISIRDQTNIQISNQLYLAFVKKTPIH